MNNFLKKKIPMAAHCSHELEQFPKSNLHRAHLFHSYNYNHFVMYNITSHFAENHFKILLKFINEY